VKVILDANILFSASNPRWLTRQLLDAFEQTGAELTSSAYVWDEAERNVRSHFPNNLNELGKLKSRLGWIEAAQAAYLSIDNPGSADDKFVSYDDATACRAKVRYAAQHGLGGVMIFELGGGYRPDQPEGGRDPLLRAVKEAVTENFLIHQIRQSGADIVISFSSAIGKEYRLERSTDLRPDSWENAATDLRTEVVDPGAAGAAQRFYRVREIRGTMP
jgi:hypothetical protein